MTHTRVQEVQGKGYLSKAADVYSFGVLLWEMFHGMPPYAADNGRLVKNTSFPRFNLRHREDVPFSYVVVALACLSKEHTQRCAPRSYALCACSFASSIAVCQQRVAQALRVWPACCAALQAPPPR